MSRTPHIVELCEWQSARVRRDLIGEGHARTLIHDFSGVIRVEREVLDDSCLRITPLGYVGAIPLGNDLILRIQPRTPVRNLFRMIERAYMLDFRLFDSLQHSRSLQDFFDALAAGLAERIRLRLKRGLYRIYQQREDVSARLRGRINMPHFVRNDWKAELPCRYEEQTADNEDNRILLWTLHLILRSRCCSPRVLPGIRKAWHALARQVSPVPCSSSQCVARSYNRLNHDYAPMHALCRFFLDSLGPSHVHGERTVPAFLISMSALFERFVAEWIRVAPELSGHGLRLAYQDRAVLHDASRLTFIFDILLKDVKTGETRYVIDTKYKTPEKPANDDIFQVLSYATQQDCPEAVLIYPEHLARPVATKVGSVRVRSLAFPLDDNAEGDVLERSGQSFLKELFAVPGR